jgi:hypothetical protein
VDTFEETILSMFGMSPEERAESDRKFGARCICPACPTYTRCAGEAQERLFCLTGKSFRCISDEKVCTCPACPVTAEFGFRHRFFCTKASETTQRYEHGLWGTRMI